MKCISSGSVITAGIFVSIAVWVSYQRFEDKTPYWRMLKVNGALNENTPAISKRKKK